MAGQNQVPQFIDDDYSPRPVRKKSRVASLPAERKDAIWNTLDKPLLIIVAMLLTLGIMMVHSAAFDWSLAEFGSETTVLVNHVFNVGVGLVAMLIFAILPPQLVKRFAVVIMLMALSFLMAVLIFGESRWGARRALLDYRFQPGEFSELATIIYMAAWLGSKNARVRSVTYGLIPFVVLVSIVSYLVIRQPDLSTAVVIIITSFLMFFLAGADIRQIVVSILAVVVMGYMAITFKVLPQYAIERINTYVAGITDLTQTSYHTQQALIAFFSGGWTGVGLGESHQKFLAIPAPHTDTIFAVIGEELGILGASVVVLLYLAFIFRGFQIAKWADDAFRGLLAAGITIWIATKAMLNIAMWTALVPPSGLPLPFISFGGSSLVVLLVGVGLLLSIQRQTIIQRNTSERRKSVASYDRGGRDRRTRIPRSGRHRSGEETVS